MYNNDKSSKSSQSSGPVGMYNKNKIKKLKGTSYG